MPKYCPHCHEAVTELDYECDRTEYYREYGLYQLGARQGYGSYEMSGSDFQDAGDSDNYCLRCPHCDEEVNEHELTDSPNGVPMPPPEPIVIGLVSDTIIDKTPITRALQITHRPCGHTNIFLYDYTHQERDTVLFANNINAKAFNNLGLECEHCLKPLINNQCHMQRVN